MPAQPSRTWREQFNDPRDKANVLVYYAPNPGLADACHGEDSGFASLSDAEAVTGTDAAETLHPRDPDSSGKAAEAELTAWPGDSDAGHFAEPSYWSGPLADTDAGHGTDGPSPVVFLMADVEVTGRAADSGRGAGAAPLGGSASPGLAVPGAVDPGQLQLTVPGTEVIDIYTFQPPFRFTGGYYSLTLPVRHAVPEIDEMRELELWRGERPDGTALRLYAAFAAGRVHFTSDTDRSGSREEGEAASLQVTVHIAPALSVGLAVS